jgi:hypothetical protein
MDRRRFLLAAAAGGMVGCSRLSFLELTPTVHAPGMQEGHMLRDGARFPAPARELTTDVAILGSGVAGLTTAWKLSKAGFHRFVVVTGPEFGGNTAGGRFDHLAFPRGAHYLPLPSLESVHVRELLADLGLLIGDPFAPAPAFDETALVHAPDGRVLFDGTWQDGPLPEHGLGARDVEEHARFRRAVEQLKQARGADGRKAFCVPLALSSRDPVWTALDRVSFEDWLRSQGYRSDTLHWYLNYACRDDYGAQYDRVSAWAGLHYFASRAGHASNAEDGAVLTWADGLNSLTASMVSAIEQRMTAQPAWRQAGFALRVDGQRGGVEILCADVTGAQASTYLVRAKRAVLAMPLVVAARVLPNIATYGFDPHTHTPSYAPWLVSNFLMGRFPKERPGATLAWDNVVYRGRGLGYVVSTHQEIRVARPPRTVFTAYQALSQHSPQEARRWLAQASPSELYDEAACDLLEAYGVQFQLAARALEVTLRGHAMASPLPGFLDNKGVAALREVDGRILFAHSDLSGLSLFEEAAWWGFRAAQRILSRAGAA